MMLLANKALFRVCRALHSASGWAYARTRRPIFVRICTELFGISMDASKRILRTKQGAV